MDRRAYLAGVAGSLTAAGGCLSTVPLLGKSIASISVAGTEGRNIELGAKPLRSRVTTARPAKVELTWTNPTDNEIALALGKGRTMRIFVGEPGKDTLPQLELYPIGRPGSANRSDNDCWVRKRNDGIESADGTMYHARVSPQESVSRTYTVWQRLPAERCSPTDKYHIEPFDRGSSGEYWWRVTLDVTNTSG